MKLQDYKILEKWHSYDRYHYGYIPTYDAYIFEVLPTSGGLCLNKCPFNPIVFCWLGYPNKFQLVPITLWLFNSSPWKIFPFLRTVNHLFRLGPSIFHGKLLVITRLGNPNDSQVLQENSHGLLIPQILAGCADQRGAEVFSAVFLGGWTTWFQFFCFVATKPWYNHGELNPISWDTTSHTILLYHVIST